MDRIAYPIRGEKLMLSLAVKEAIHTRQTSFQRIDIVQTEAFGRMLLLDGHVQLAELDEHAYHEALVHIPALSIDKALSALVVGGGDGAVARELCKHPKMERIDVVEIDAGVVEACREHMPWLSDGAFDDPRVSLHIEDAFEFVKRERRPYELIVMDSTDVYEGEDGALSEALFTSEFYKDCRRVLSPAGILVTQADNPVFCPYSMEAILRELSKVFTKVGSYQALVPSFGGFSGFVWASESAGIACDFPSKRAAHLRLMYLNESTWALAMRPLSFGPALQPGASK